MAWDEALLSFVSRIGRPVLRLYAWTQPAASFGYFQHYDAVAAATPLRPLLRRPTGGGLVPHVADWTYALAIPTVHPWYRLRAEDSYLRLHTWLQTAFRDVGVATDLAPEAKRAQPGCCFEGYERHDLLWHGRKIAGAAQRRSRSGLLIQGSIQPPVAGWDRPAFHRALLHAAQLLWGVQWAVFEPPSELQTLREELLRAKYERPEYHRRR
jgi:lipoate-protein ligase A